MLSTGLLLAVLAACQRQPPAVADAPVAPPATAPADAAAAPADSASDAPVVLADVIETDPRYVVGISYPPGADADQACPRPARVRRGRAAAS